MKSQVKFFIFIIVLAIAITGVALYQKGYFTKSAASRVPSSAVKTSSDTNSSPKKDVINIQSINNSMVGKNVSIIGEITNRSESKDGHVFLTVKDSTGEILIPIFANKKITSDNLKSGSQFQFSGKVDEYKGELEVIPEKQEDIVSVHTAAKIEAKDEGQIKTINGKILTKYTHPEGHIFLTVQTESGQELDIPLFQTLNPNPDNYPINSEVSVKGKVSVYKGKMEVIPGSLNDVTILVKGDDSTVQNVNLSDLTESDRGKMVITKGFVKNVVEKDGHVFFTLSAGGKEIKSVLFKADSKEIVGRKTRILNAEKAQFDIRVLGMVDVYNGDLEVIIEKVFVD